MSGNIKLSQGAVQHIESNIKTVMGSLMSEYASVQNTVNSKMADWIASAAQDPDGGAAGYLERDAKIINLINQVDDVALRFAKSVAIGGQNGMETDVHIGKTMRS
jgi:hypothetical protein